MLFSKIEWPRVQPGLVRHSANKVSGAVYVVDAAGEDTQCNVDLLMGMLPDGTEQLTGTICQRLAGGDGSRVELRLLLQTDCETLSASLSFMTHEQADAHQEMSVALALTGSIVHWTVYALALKLGASWTLQLELSPENLTDRIMCKLQEELLMVCEFTDDSIDDCAHCLPPQNVTPS